MVGSAALHAMIRSPSITKISVLSRRPVPQAEESDKCKTTLIDDFSIPPNDSVLSSLRGAHGCVWALGISQNQVSKEQYRLITYDYALVAAKASAEHLATKGEDGKTKPFNFVYVSGEGATTSPGRLTPRFGKVKGETEAALLALGKDQAYTDKLRVYSARPAGADPKGHKEVEEALKLRHEGFYKKIEVPARAVLRQVAPGWVMSPTFHLGEALVMLASGDGEPLDGTGIEGEGRTVRNIGLRRMAGI